MKKHAFALVALAATAAAGCVRLPTGVEPVSPFDAERYLGTWYEVAR
ncbi:MAG TPA: lipocalin, partial [Pseudomonas sp.]|nr:lipocalin [Pseudomonas sp.]